MSTQFWIERLDAHHRVLERIPCGHDPVFVGRAYDNQVIIDDDQCALHHARVTLAGDRVRIEDLGSRNGLLLRRKVHRQLDLSGDDIVTIGRTRLRIRTAGYQSGRAEQLRERGLMEGLVGAVATLLAVAWFTWVEQVDASPGRGFAIMFLDNLFRATSLLVWWVLLLWAPMCLGYSGRARFGRFMLMGGISMLAVVIGREFFERIVYALSWESLAHFRTQALMLLACPLLLWHLRMIESFRRQTAVALTAGVTALGILVSLQVNYLTEKQLAGNYHMWFLPEAGVRVAGDVSLPVFIEQARALQTLADSKLALSDEYMNDEQE